MSNGRRIVCAANRMPDTGTIVIGVRHFDEFMKMQMYHSGETGWAKSEQGFIDQRGRFMTREEALEIAMQNGQIYRRCSGDDKELFSENLY